MPASLRIEEVRALGPWIEQFAAEAAAEGFRHVGRLQHAYENGENRFDREGECLLHASLGPDAAGVCGLNRDPYTADGRTGRLRHLYVLPRFRRQGVGRALVTVLVAAARTAFVRVRLRTETDEADRFYRAIGFVPCGEPDATHVIEWT